MWSNVEIFSTLDLENFSWLPLWKKDQELREKIEKCQEKIKEIKQKYPFSREEIKRQFELARNIFRESQLELIKKEAEKVQIPQPVYGYDIGIPFYQGSVLDINDIEVLTKVFSCYCIFEVPGVWEKIEQVIEKLPEGVSQKEKTELIKKEEAKIDSYCREINKNLSPKERWLYDKRGNQRPYPRGCRWTRYVDILKLILPFLEELANIDNKPLNSEARKHFKECGFHKLVGTAKVSELYKLGKQVGVSVPIDLYRD